jgi:hypothetical protein
MVDETKIGKHSIEGRRRSFFSFGWPANTTESVPPLSRTTSISRLRPISVLLCRLCASSMNKAIGLCRFLIRSRSARSRLLISTMLAKSRLLARLAVAKERSGWMSLLVLEWTVIRSCSVN